MNKPTKITWWNISLFWARLVALIDEWSGDMRYEAELWVNGIWKTRQLQKKCRSCNGLGDENHWGFRRECPIYLAAC